MAEVASTRDGGAVFDRIAESYDRVRPAYPDALLHRVCALAGLEQGDLVLEVGCGSGQLTRGLLARGLRVVAVEPGERLAALAARNLEGRGEVGFVKARFEDAELPEAGFRAVFSAAAFHWLDPSVSWAKVARLLAPGGTLALLQHCGLWDEWSRCDQEALLAALRGVAPEVAAEWPTYRALDATLAGVEARADNVSEAWSWVGSYDLARPEVAELFDTAQVACEPMPLEHTAEQLNALVGTLSFCQRITPAQRRALEAANAELHERLGRPLRSSTAAVLVTARAAR